MPTKCLNCGNALTGNYCAQCGQKAEVRRLDWHSLGEEVFHFFTHIEKGFLFTSRDLIIRPHRLCKDYLEGKRKSYHKPIGFLLIWITIFTLVYHGAHSFTHFQYIPRKGSSNSLFSFDREHFSILGRYRSIVELLLLPVSAFISWFFIGRSRLNYVEVLTVFFYFISFLFMWMSAQYLIAVVASINFKHTYFDMVSTGVFVVWLVWSGYRFYRQYAIPWLIPRIIVSLTVAGIVYFLLMAAIVNQLLDWHF